MVAITECNLRVSMQQVVAIDSIKSSQLLQCSAFCAHPVMRTIGKEL